jgi:hypothetical protein
MRLMTNPEIKPFDEEKYFNALWDCYINGVEKEGLHEKELFIALVKDLVRQIYDNQSKQGVAREAIKHIREAWEAYKHNDAVFNNICQPLWQAIKKTVEEADG